VFTVDHTAERGTTDLHRTCVESHVHITAVHILG